VSLALLGGVVLCSLLFIVYTLVRYFETISPLNQAIPDLRIATEAKHVRLVEYYQRIEELKVEIPRSEVRLGRLEKWIELLTKQHAGLQDQEIEKQRAKLEKGNSGKTGGPPS
jgi:hypothetical protein